MKARAEGGEGEASRRRGRCLVARGWQCDARYPARRIVYMAEHPGTISHHLLFLYL
ncbi:hypothetical protein J6590_011318 [Homalodisca vitripennis]|nr:hypothetical protein J6590_011318 [Homalodisca vitripennis]